MPARGFTLVELLIGVAIIAILMLVALPSYREFMANGRIRSVAGSIADGIKLAQVEAIRRNTNVTFTVDPAVGWEVRFLESDGVTLTLVQSEPFGEAAGQVVVDPNPPAAVKLTWSGIGQYIPTTNPDDGSDALTSVSITSSAVASAHDLRVVADPAFGRGVQVCDKRFATTDPIGCPAGVP
jgi:type IV fimbrial biogenesis protein FimT